MPTATGRRESGAIVCHVADIMFTRGESATIDCYELAGAECDGKQLTAQDLERTCEYLVIVYGCLRRVRPFIYVVVCDFVPERSGEARQRWLAAQDRGSRPRGKAQRQVETVPCPQCFVARPVSDVRECGVCGYEA